MVRYSMVRVSQVVNLMPLQETSIPFLGWTYAFIQCAGFSEGDTDLLVLTEVTARGTAINLCYECLADVPHLLGTEFSSVWVHRYEQGLMKQQLPHFIPGLW